MKKKLVSFAALLCGSWLAYAQGVLVYDQQSATNDVFGGAFGSPVRPLGFFPDQLIGQSFVPAFSAIDFVRFSFGVARTPGTAASGMVSVNLWEGGISNGVLLAATAPVFISLPLFTGTVATNFYFAALVSLTPGTTYYLQPFVQSQVGNLGIEQFSPLNSPPPYTDPYPAGMAFVYGLASPTDDLWFREEIVMTPEPATGKLLFAAALFGFLFAGWQKRLS